MEGRKRSGAHASVQHGGDEVVADALHLILGLVGPVQMLRFSQDRSFRVHTHNLHDKERPRPGLARIDPSGSTPGETEPAVDQRRVQRRQNVDLNGNGGALNTLVCYASVAPTAALKAILCVLEEVFLEPDEMY